MAVVTTMSLPFFQWCLLQTFLFCSIYAYWFRYTKSSCLNSDHLSHLKNVFACCVILKMAWDQQQQEVVIDLQEVKRISSSNL